jgi:lambda family phage portal protein
MSASDASLIDRAISAVAPQWALRRLRARRQIACLGVSGGYDSASTTKPALAGWLAQASDARSDINPALPTLRARSRDLARTSPLAGGALSTIATAVVGTGLSCQPQPDVAALGLSVDQAQAWSDATLREWRQWSESDACDLTRTQSFFGLQSTAFLSALESGDVFVLLADAPWPGSPYRLALQMIEADRVCNPGRVQDNARISAGVELDDAGAPLRYHVCSGYPTAAGAGRVQWTQRAAFTADGRRSMLHLFERRRPGQVRGVPILAPVIEPLKQLKRYTDAELDAAVAAATFAVFIRMDPEAFSEIFDDAARATYLSSATTWDRTIPQGAIGPGAKAINLLPGESAESPTPGRPSAGFDPFFLAIVRQIGVGIGLPHEVLIKHFTASYSAAQAALLDAWRHFRCRRDWLAAGLCQPVYAAWLDEAVALGRVIAPGYFADPALRHAWSQAVWVGDGPGSIDPTKSVEAAVMRIEAGISTIAAESVLHDGVDWRIKHRQRVVEQSARSADGLDRPPAPPRPPGAPTPDEDVPEREDET